MITRMRLNTRNLTSQINKASRSMMASIAPDIQEVINRFMDTMVVPQVPVDTGTLKRSNYRTKVVRKKKNSLASSFGFAGKRKNYVNWKTKKRASAYALKVHQRHKTHSQFLTKHIYTYPWMARIRSRVRIGSIVRAIQRRIG